MENIGNVTRYAAQRVIHPMEALRLVPTVDGKDWFQDEAGDCWRMYYHIEKQHLFPTAGFYHGLFKERQGIRQLSGDDGGVPGGKAA